MTQTLLPKLWQGVKLGVGYLCGWGALFVPSPIQWTVSLNTLPRFRIWTMSNNITVKMSIIQLNSLSFPRGEISAPPQGMSIIFFSASPWQTFWSCRCWQNDCGARRETSTWSRMTALHTHPITASATERSNPQCVKWSVMVHPLGYYLRMRQSEGTLARIQTQKHWLFWTLSF